MRLPLCALASALLILGFLGNTAFAQGVGASISPGIIEDRLDPGQTFAGSISVSNVSDTEETYYMVVRDVTDVDEGGRPYFSDEEALGGLSLKDWVTFDRTEVTIGAGQSATVGYTIHVPENASPGSYVGGIFADRVADQMIGQGASIGYQVGALVSMQLAGEVVEDVQIREFATGKALYTLPEVDFVVTVVNNGTVVEKPIGFIEITNMLGTKVATVNVNEEGGRVLPGVHRVYNVSWAGEGFHFGRYEAVLTLSYGTQARSSITRTHSFWIFPMKELAIVLGGVLVILLAAYLGVRSYIRRELKKAGHTRSRSAARQTTFAAKLSQVLIKLVIATIVAIAFIVLFFS